MLVEFVQQRLHFEFFQDLFKLILGVVLNRFHHLFKARAAMCSTGREGKRLRLRETERERKCPHLRGREEESEMTWRHRPMVLRGPVKALLSGCNSTHGIWARECMCMGQSEVIDQQTPSNCYFTGTWETWEMKENDKTEKPLNI